MKRIIVLIFLSVAIPFALLAQTRITGTVKDVNGPLNNASIIEKGNVKNGTVADNDGKFVLTLRGTSRTLVVRRVGYADQEVKLGENQNDADVLLQPNDAGLDQVIVVGYGTKKRITNTGAVSSIQGAAIRNVPTSNVQNTLQGKLPGFFSVQRGGQPGKDASDFFIRGVSSLNAGGNQPLIVVDDVQYTYEQLSQINVNEIESISILKDASTTAIYGIKGASGVLVVRTRRGISGKPQINVRVEVGRQNPTITPKFLSAYNAATLENEAFSNDGLAPKFTQEDLDHFKTGDDPYGHPDVNWYNTIFRGYSYQANTNIDISGGSENVKYFISTGAFTQNGNIRNFNDPRNDGVNNQYFYHRYNFRSNLDIQATKSTKFRLDVTGRFGQINNPIFFPFFADDQVKGIMGEILDYTRTTPWASPVLNPNGSYSYPYLFGNYTKAIPTINARLATLGYYRASQVDYNTLFSITENLDYITKGLSLEGRIAYAGVSNTIRSLQRGGQPPAYHYDPASGAYLLGTQLGYVLPSFVLRTDATPVYNKRVNVYGFINYDRTFGDHHVYGTFLYNKENYSSLADVPAKFQGVSLKSGYDYKQKYLIDFNAGYNGSDRFSSANRYGFFPAVGVGWNISKESFFKNAFPWVDLFKIRGSYGLVGSDAIFNVRYLYSQFYNQTGSYPFGESVNAVTAISEGALGNPKVSWEKQKEADIGLDANFFKDKISVTVDYFNNYRYDILSTPNSVPVIIGVGLPVLNLARVRNKGFDGQIKYQDNIGNVQFDITTVFSYAKNKILYFDEPAQAFPWLARTGQSIGQPFGYTAIGFYQDQADIDKSAKPVVDPSIIKPGDIKYKDLNGDGVINEKDQGAIGRPNLPNTSAGVTFGVHYKGLDISILFQGAFNYSLILNGTAIEPFQTQWQPVHEQRWTPDNNIDAKFPRLSTFQTTSSPTNYPSTFWLLNAMYVRMKTVELGYRLPQKALPFKINNARIYFSAYNLLTWTNFDLYQQDPEVQSFSAGDAYLNQRVMNLGIQIGF